MPNKGRLKEPSVELLGRAGLVPEENGRSLSAKVLDENIQVRYLRAKDIPLYISEGAIDVGITGYDIWQESGLELKELLDLGFGECELVLAGPEKYRSIELRSRVKVGTCFPNLTMNYFSRRGAPARIIKVSGAVEVLPRLGVANLIVDLTSTGRTLEENGLVVLDNILSSTARLLCKRRTERCVEFAKRIEEVLK